MWNEEKIRLSLKNIEAQITKLEALDDRSFYYHSHRHALLVAVRNTYAMILDDSDAGWHVEEFPGK